MATVMVKFAQALGSVLAGSWLGWLAVSAEQTLAQTPIPSSQRSSAPIAPATLVSQPSEVQPTNWVYRALESLNKTYGCVEGDPDRPNEHTLRRYEMVAAVNSCSVFITQLIAHVGKDFVSQDDLATLQRLQEEFKTELAILADVKTSDVQQLQPTHWAYRATFSLWEKYSPCGVAFYPDGSVRIERPLSRFELAARLRICINYITRLSTESNDVVSQDDLVTLQRLQDEFVAELANLHSRIGELDRRAAQLVSPTDWSYRALRSLREKYGCNQGYPEDPHESREHPVSRYEMAVGVRVCHNYLTEIIAQLSIAQLDNDFVSPDDLATLQRLREEFNVEVAILQKRLEVIERLVTLSEYQFQSPVVQPTDYLYRTVTFLNEKYGCAAVDFAYYDGPPPRGSMSRYDLALRVNICRDRFADEFASVVSQDDLAMLQRLEEEFSAELEILTKVEILRNYKDKLDKIVGLY